MTTEVKKESFSEIFVDAIIERIKNDNGMAAAFRRADNLATEYQSWEYLAKFNIALDNENKRLPYTTIAAAIAKSKIEKNGTNNIGAVLASCYDEGNNSDQAKSKLRRLLACNSIQELCRVLRPLFSLMTSKGKINIDFSHLLSDMLRFQWDDQRQRIKSRWAESFYRSSVETEQK